MTILSSGGIIVKKRLICTCVILLACLLSCSASGCTRNPGDSNHAGLRVVTAVTVIYENGPINTQRHYTTDGKIQQILDYLRLIVPYGKPEEDPETADGSNYHIVLSYSDGQQKAYRQKGDRYLQGTDGSWQKIDPSQAEELGRIIGQLESDIEL